MRVLPKRLIPIIFLPGIMGSNLRLNRDRQIRLKESHNVAWMPDSKARMGWLAVASNERRQLQLDPDASEVDCYDPVGNSTGSTNETSDERHGSVNAPIPTIIDSPLLFDDPVLLRDSKTKEQKAKMRGWGEVFFGSYGVFLNTCETMLNTGDIAGTWHAVLNRNPMEWGGQNLAPLTLDDLTKTFAGTYFPVHAFGYNWLQSNRISALSIKAKLVKLIDQYKREGFQCEKVIVVTHSMGGLVARALIHPDIGGLETSILGIVHSVMPAVGAPAAYKRMRCGFESDYGRELILGRAGWQVTPVLGNSPGGLELLPSGTYGNEWLEVRANGVLLTSLPQNGDPYAEIYKRTDVWYGLIREKWLNPALLPTSTFAATCRYLDQAKKFHQMIDATYHPVSYAHYGVDETLASFEKVCWNVSHTVRSGNWQQLHIVADSGTGALSLSSTPDDESGAECIAKLAPSAGAGDKTVPVRSAKHQQSSRKFSGLFLQKGYEHQGSLQNSLALESTMYSVAKIAQRMQWEEI